MSKIITPNSPQKTLGPAAVDAPLTVQEASTIGGALQRYRELSETTPLIQTAEGEAEKRGLRDFLNEKLLLHADIFLGSFFVVKTEYEPGLQVLARLAQRIAAINDRTEELRKQKEVSELPSA
jgi:hypothetical protein